MRIALLHTRLSGYFTACLCALKQRTGVELLVHAYPRTEDAPFDPVTFSDLGHVRNRRECPDGAILETVLDFRPDAILVSGWGDKGYLQICRQLRRRGIPVIAGCDTQWTGSLRQHIASWIAPWHVQRAIDVLWVTGERQARLAWALGFSGDRLWEGYYACDWLRFSNWREPDTRLGEKEVPQRFAEIPQRQIGEPKAFLYVGRYVPEKGVGNLAAAYRLYRNSIEEPWDLICAGAGPLREILLAAGAFDRGFVQPEALPELMQGASAFILPSRFEPWGVVVQEAAASGLPLICSDACGAAVHLLREQFNGLRFPADDSGALAERMTLMHRLSNEERSSFGESSFELSKQYTPEIWVQTLVTGLRRISLTKA